jgi:hypothetical protein
MGSMVLGTLKGVLEDLTLRVPNTRCECAFYKSMLTPLVSKFQSYIVFWIGLDFLEFQKITLISLIFYLWNILFKNLKFKKKKTSSWPS